jgi:hypothetical protein
MVKLNPSGKAFARSSLRDEAITRIKGVCRVNEIPKYRQRTIIKVVKEGKVNCVLVLR